MPPHLAAFPADKLASRVLSGDQLTARWIGPMFFVFAAILVVWIAILAITLPERGILHNEDVVWVGFDIGLLAGLIWTAWAALRRNRSLPLAAAATGALLMTDAWFDVVGSDGHDRMAAIVMALLVELPLSAVCWWLALHSQELAARRVSRLIVWWRQVEGGDGEQEAERAASRRAIGRRKSLGFGRDPDNDPGAAQPARRGDPAPARAVRRDPCRVSRSGWPSARPTSSGPGRTAPGPAWTSRGWTRSSRSTRRPGPLTSRA